METTCDACGQPADEYHMVQELTELGFGPAHQGMTIHLCQGCVKRREATRWRKSDPTARPLLEALEDRHAPPQERYTYLQDPQETIHLLRLRPSWVDRQATGVAEA